MKSLYYAVVVFALLGVSFSKFTEEMLSPGDKECIEELGLEIRHVLDSVNDDFSTREGDTKINEYTECWYRKLNVIDENNQIKYDVLKPLFAAFIEVINQHIVDKNQVSHDAVESCKSLEGHSLGDRLVRVGNCVIKYAQQIEMRFELR